MCLTSEIYKLIYVGYASFDEIIAKRNEIFDREKKKQFEAVGRIEKIEVRYLGVPEDQTFIMNKHISTPFDCAKRKSSS